jgi:hypothetical protein
MLSSRFICVFLAFCWLHLFDHIPKLGSPFKIQRLRRPAAYPFPFLDQPGSFSGTSFSFPGRIISGSSATVASNEACTAFLIVSGCNGMFLIVSGLLLTAPVVSSIAAAWKV